MALPSKPFDVEATKEAVARRIEAGDITREDIDILQSGYRNMTLLSSITSVAMAVPTYYVMKRRVPPYPLGVRLLAAGGMGMLGSFLGFSLGGVGAAMEVRRKMQNPEAKMRVFQEIAAEAQQAAMIAKREGRTGIPPPSGSRGGAMGSAGGPSGVTMSSGRSGYDYEAAREQAAERDRERDFQRDVGAIERDATFAGQAPDRGSISGMPSTRPAAGSDAAAGSGTAGPGSTTTWDRLRAQAFPQGQPRQQSGSPATPVSDPYARSGPSDNGFGGKSDERSKEQREFDAMLEKERQGVPANEVWR